MNQTSEREKTTAEINQAIAKVLGWREVEVEEMAMHFPGGWLPAKVKRWTTQPEGQIIVGGAYELPSFSTDANTRPEMLAALTKEEDVALWELIGRESLKAGKTHYQFTLRLDQPTFAKLFCKIKGLI